MTKYTTVLAFDLGASSGRALIGEFDATQHTLRVTEVHRFANEPVQVGKHLYWDILRLLHEVKQGIHKAQIAGYHDIQSIGIDSWAVDFGLLSADGELLGNPYHYRDAHTDGVMESVKKRIDEAYVYERTGLQFLPFNTIYQLIALTEHSSPILAHADKLLMIPDLLRYFLTGVQKGELTNASTTQLYNPRTGTFDSDLLHMANIPHTLMPDLVQAGTRVGHLTREVQLELAVPAIPVIAVGEHDTASAVAAVPAHEGSFAYLISGTWSLLGTETRSPVITNQSQAWNFTNEAGVYGTNRLLKNIMGLWLMQECKRAWDAEGDEVSFSELVELAQQAHAFRSFIHPDDARFLHPGQLPSKIQQFCAETSQPIPQSKGEMIRCVLESLAFAYRFVFERTAQLANQSFAGLYMVGGIQNELLSQFTANALGKPVWTGPIEASAIGNMLVQYIALGDIADLSEARDIVRRSFPMKTYWPQDIEVWHAAYERYVQFVR